MRIFAISLIAVLTTACGGSDDSESGVSGIRFGEIGPLSGADGKSSFRFGVATAATQIEDQNPNTDWYVFTQPAPDGLGNGEAFVGDAVKGYSLAIQDVELLKSLHVDSYRFSIEWARVEPKRDQIDEAALQHYSDLIDALRAANIRPIITLHHFSNPIWVDDPRDETCASGPSDQNLCGLGHPIGGPQVVEEMGQHAALLAKRFGDRVDEWGTLNEPINYLLAAYGVGSFPPGKLYAFSLLEKFIPVFRDYVSGHAAMYQAIKQNDATDADGDGLSATVGLSLATIDLVPSRENLPSEDPEDIAAKDRAEYVFHHILVDSLREGRFDSDLDGQPDEDQPTWKGTLDWLGVQYYLRAGVTGAVKLFPVVNLTPCIEALDSGACVPPLDPSFCVPQMSYEYYAPGLYNVLADFSERWPDLPLVVTESGIATDTGERRAENVVRALEQIARARDDGMDVRGYYHWSLMDNFEWARGYGPHFGLYRVDLTTYERTPTGGADALSRIAEARKLSREDLERFGGTGPMTPDGEALGTTLCNGKN